MTLDNTPAEGTLGDAMPDLPRREFLKATAAIGGGLVIALTLPGCGSKVEQAARPTMHDVNAWLRIGTDDSITIFCDRSEMGQGVYTALPTLVAEELGVALESVTVQAAPAGDAYINNLLGTQVTGGSSSVRDGWTKLRIAGAQAREMLVATAAKRWGNADVATLRVENGEVIASDGKRLRFGELVEEAAKLPVPEKPHLKDASEFMLIGKPVKRIDTPSKVDGTAQFGIDVTLPGMLYAAIALSPALGGSVKSFKADAARQSPGVREVLQTSSGVIVVADKFWQAHKARELLEIEWEPGPNVALDSDAIRKGLRDAARRNGAVARNDGDVDAALRSAARRFEQVYELPLLAHATMEPMNCTVDVRADKCDVYTGTQVQIVARDVAAKAAGMKPEQVSIHTTYLGGGFGRRLEADFIPAAVEASKAMGKPVKLVWTREDDMTHDVYRPPAYDVVSAGFDKSGKLTAWKLHLTGPSITARWAPAVVEKMIDPFALEAATNYPYDVPNVYVDYNRHEIGIDVGYWRSVSHALNCFVAESFMDELAAAARQDPFEFRKGLLGKQPRYLKVLTLAAERAGWGAPPAGRHQGIALMEGYGTYMAQVAEISLARAGGITVHRIVCVLDCGQVVNPDIVTAQVESAAIFGLTAALHGDVTLKGGRVEQTNFDNYRVLRIDEVPTIETHIVASSEPPGGMGEPATALVAPAVCNAIYAATGKRLRSLPIAQHGLA